MESQAPIAAMTSGVGSRRGPTVVNAGSPLGIPTIPPPKTTIMTPLRMVATPTVSMRPTKGGSPMTRRIASQKMANPSATAHAMPKETATGKGKPCSIASATR